MAEIKNLAVKCHVCDNTVSLGDSAYNGLLINSQASLGSRLIENREKLAMLQKKRWSKQHTKQRENDFLTIAKLQADIKHDEELHAQIMEILKRIECHG